MTPNVSETPGFCNTTMTGHISLNIGSLVWGPDIDGEGSIIQYLVTVPFSFGYKFVAWQAAGISSAVRLRCAVQMRWRSSLASIAGRKSVDAEDYERVQCMAKDRQRDDRSNGGVKEVQDGVNE